MLTVEDRIAIQELVARFAYCSDFCDWEGLGKLYVADVVTELAGLSVSYQGIPAQVEHAGNRRGRPKAKTGIIFSTCS